MGTLYYGDNLDILRRYLKDETVNLVYLDPPFNSAQNYNAFFQEKDGSAAASQIHAFEDTWHWDIETKKAYDAVTEQPGKVSDVMQAFYTFLGGNDMMAYLTMMSSRLVELRRVLKPIIFAKIAQRFSAGFANQANQSSPAGTTETCTHLIPA